MAIKKRIPVIEEVIVEKTFPVRLKQNYFSKDGKHQKGTTIHLPIDEAQRLVQSDIAEVDFDVVVERFY